MNVAQSVKFKVSIARTLKDAIESIPDITAAIKPELFVIFGYNSLGESL